MHDTTYRHKVLGDMVLEDFPNKVFGRLPFMLCSRSCDMAVSVGNQIVLFDPMSLRIDVR